MYDCGTGQEQYDRYIELTHKVTSCWALYAVETILTIEAAVEPSHSSGADLVFGLVGVECIVWAIEIPCDRANKD